MPPFWGTTPVAVGVVDVGAVVVEVGVLVAVADVGGAVVVLVVLVGGVDVGGAVVVVEVVPELQADISKPTTSRIPINPKTIFFIESILLYLFVSDSLYLTELFGGRNGHSGQNHSLF